MSPSRDGTSWLAVLVLAGVGAGVMSWVSPTRTVWLGFVLYFALFLVLFGFGLRDAYRCTTLLRRLVAR